MNLDMAIEELKAAKAARDTAKADLAVLQEQYADLGRQAQAAGPQVQKTALLQEQHRVMGAQSPYMATLEAAEARVRAAKMAVGNAAEAEA